MGNYYKQRTRDRTRRWMQCWCCVVQDKGVMSYYLRMHPINDVQKPVIYGNNQFK